MKNARCKFFKMLLSALIFTACATSATAQDVADDKEPTVDQNQKPEAPKKVDVQPIARDDEIETRLQDILTATEWFEDAAIEVKDGVVFLRGTALQESYRSWATELAQNTQDVAAVVNRMELEQRPIYDMSPAIAELKNLTATAIQTIPLLLFGVVVFVLTWFAAHFAKRVANWFLQGRVSNSLLRRVITQSFAIPILLLGVYIVLRVSGLTQLAFTVLGGTGIAGLIIGIAFRDIAENFLASILISVQNPFRVGDLIEVGEHIGFVQRVSTRGTLLMTFDGNHVTVPNAIIYKSTITNLTANPNRRVEFTIGIGYDDSVTKAQEIVKDVLVRHPSVLQDPESRVFLSELGASTVNLKVWVWLDATKNNPDLVRSSCMRMIKQALMQEGISLPDEAREVIFPNQVPVRMITDDTSANSGSGPLPDKHADSPKPAEPEHVESVISAGEGNLENEAEEIQRQAANSWSPEEGTNLLDETSDNLERESKPVG